MDHGTQVERRKRAWAGLFCIGTGLVLMTIMGWNQASLRVPTFIGYLAAGTFVLAGATLLLQAGGRDRIASVFSFLTIAGLALVGGWVGFGPGPRGCEASVGGLSFLPEEMVCRVVFGTGAVLTGLIGLALLWSIIRGARMLQ
jgi:hypothetical protein